MTPILASPNFCSSFEMATPKDSKTTLNGLFELMNLSESQWNERKSENLNIKIQKYCSEYIPEGQTEQELGLIEKHDLEKGSHIAVLGELGDQYLDGMDLILKDLQKNGYLDKHFHSVQNHHIVFLCPPLTDIKAFEMILTLKMENVKQIHLISSYPVNINEENSQKTQSENKHSFMINPDLVKQLCHCLPKKVYLGQKTDGKKQYVQFNHNICWFDSDPSPLLDNDLLNHIWMKNSNTLSQRIQNNSELQNKTLLQKNEKLLIAAKNLSTLFTMYPDLNHQCRFNIGSRFSYDKNSQTGVIPIEIVKSYLLSSSIKNKVKALFLGEKYKQDNAVQDIFIHKTLQNKTAAITINPSYNRKFNIAHLVVNEKVRHWKTFITKNYLGFEIDNIDRSWRPFIKNKKEIALTSLADLMALPTAKWNNRNIDFLNAKIEEYCKTCVPQDYSKNSVAFIEKYDLAPESKIAVIGDIHGNGLRLHGTLETLRNENFLNEKYQCNPLHHIIFLGDYVNRGENNLKVLELLSSIKLENKDQVHLIRGNHEDFLTIDELIHYSKRDDLYYNYRMDSRNDLLLNIFFQTLPSSVYLGQNNEYVQFSHGGVHFKTDPVPLLETERTHLWINDSPEFSNRIQSLINVENIDKTKQEIKWQKAAAELDRLSKKIHICCNNIYWHDLGDVEQPIDQNGRTQISLKSLKSYLLLSGKTKKVKCLVRGHQHKVDVHRWGKKGKLIAITLDPSDDELTQTIVIMKTHPKFSQWKNNFLTFTLKNHQYPTINCIPYEA